MKTGYRQLLSPFPPFRTEPAQAVPAMDVIFIEGFTGETVIGIHDSELHRPQPIVVDVHAGLARAGACDTDRIADTIDYGCVRERLHRLLREHRLQLLEAFAEAVADILLDEFGAVWVRVKVVKPKKFDDVAAVGVQIERAVGEDRRRGTPQSGGGAVLRMPANSPAADGK